MLVMNGPMHPRFDIGQIGFLATPCSLRPSVIVGAVQRMAAPCYFASTDRDRTPPGGLAGGNAGHCSDIEPTGRRVGLRPPREAATILRH
jgi:hypothetical protein